MRTQPGYLEQQRAYYADPAHWVEFICHWVDTYDPRNTALDKPVYLPLVLFPKQAEMVEFIIACWQDQQPGLIDKSRDMGATWVGCALSVCMWLFVPGIAIGWGSRKEELVDKIGQPDSIFEKMRIIINRLPREFLPAGFVPKVHAKHLTIVNPANKAVISGEGGDNQGRGGRKAIYFKDEAAHYEHPDAIEAALGDNTNCPIDMSSPSIVGSLFDRKKESGIPWGSVPRSEIPRGFVRVFVLDWSHHPAKTPEWHSERKEKHKREGTLDIFYREVDHNPAAALAGVVIPWDWVETAIDAHLKLAGTLGSFYDGPWCGALDLAGADSSGDLNALVFRKGVVLVDAAQWGQEDSGVTARKALAEAANRLPCDLQYDASGGYGDTVKAEERRLRKEKNADGTPYLSHQVVLVPWNAGGAVLRPEEHVLAGDRKSPKNKDYYSNLKAQGWWNLRTRFWKTFQAVTEGIKHNPSELISIDSRIPLLHQLKRQLCQPVVTHDGRLRLKIDKTPEGASSPNLGDAIMMSYFPMPRPIVVTGEMLAKAARIKR